MTNGLKALVLGTTIFLALPMVIRYLVLRRPVGSSSAMLICGVLAPIGAEIVQAFAPVREPVAFLLALVFSVFIFIGYGLLYDSSAEPEPPSLPPPYTLQIAKEMREMNRRRR